MLPSHHELVEREVERCCSCDKLCTIIVSFVVVCRYLDHSLLNKSLINIIRVIFVICRQRWLDEEAERRVMAEFQFILIFVAF